MEHKRYDFFNLVTPEITDLYYATKTEQRIPRRITTGNYRINDFIMNTYSTDPIPETTFAVPQYCQNTCPATTICGKYQMNQVL